MVQRRSYHKDRASTPAERARAFRERRAKKKRHATSKAGASQTGDSIARKVHARLNALGKSPADNAATLEVFRELYPRKDAREAARAAYKRALPRVLQIERWAALTCKWAGQQWDNRPDAALEFVHGFLADAGEFRIPVVAKIYDFLDAQPWAWNSRTFKQLQRYRKEMADNPTKVPTLALWSKRKTDEIIEAILKLMRRNPKRRWASCELAEKLNLPQHKVRYVTKVMCKRVPALLMRLGERGPFALPDPNIQTRKPGTWRAIQMAYEKRETGVRFIELQSAIGPTPSALRTLRKNGVFTPADPKRKAPIRLTSKAVAMIERGEPIRNKSGVIMWAPSFFQA